jgi:transposase InsO family protein
MLTIGLIWMTPLARLPPGISKIQLQNVEELRRALAEFRERYNQRWIVQRLGYLTPAQARQKLLALGAAA